MSANDLLRYFALLRNYPRNKIDERINELLFLFKLTKWKHEKVSKFSKGMKQKLGIAQAIIHDPSFIILDEPQTGLDPNARIEIRQLIRYLQDQGKTIFVASHLLYEISEVCNKIALINRGKIIAFDTIDNLEKTLKRKEIDCEILEPIPPELLGNIIKRLTVALEPYLDKDLDPKVSKIPIKYMPNEQVFKIYYEGSRNVRAEILKILINEFESDFSVVSFTRPRTSQLEGIYSQMIKEDDERFENEKKKVK
ncbi:MAG: ABC transporter ATP-binding protein, partial [Promethearchaeota archaeon]